MSQTLPAQAKKVSTLDDVLRNLDGPEIQKAKKQIPREELIKKRNLVLRELLETENSYVKALNQTIEHYLLPCREDSSLLSKKQILLIFGNIEEICAFNKQLLDSLRSAVEGDGNLGDLFIKLIPSFKVYSEYCSKHKAALECITERIQSNLKFDTFLVRKRQEVMGLLELPAMLIKPIQRLVMYRLLFQQLLENTPEDHADLKPVECSLKNIEELNMLVNESVRAYENKVKIKEIMQNLSKCPNLEKAERRFVREGELVKLCRKAPKRRYFILFNDSIIYASFNDVGVAGPPHRFHRMITLERCVVTDLGDTEVMHNAFQVLSKQKSFTVFAQTPEEKEEWVNAINDSIAGFNKKGPLSKVASSTSVNGSASSTTSSATPSIVEDDDASSGAGDQPTDASVAPVWIPDSLQKNCMSCNSKFTAVNRRHHCRKCGKLVCGDCSSHKFKLQNLGKSARVCDDCYSVLAGVEVKKKVRIVESPKDGRKAPEEEVATLAAKASKMFKTKQPASPARKAKASSTVLKAGVYKGPPPTDGSQPSAASGEGAEGDSSEEDEIIDSDDEYYEEESEEDELPTRPAPEPPKE